MAYVEVWKSGRLLTRRCVDEEKARKGCRVRLGAAGEVRVAVGQTETIGTFEVRMLEGEPFVEADQIGQTVSRLPTDEPRLPPLSVRATDHHVGQIDEYPDIKGYKIIEPLGRGGMGMVWRAEQLSTRRQVALKLSVSHTIESPKAHALFQREVELTARLDHPHIARIYDSGLHQGMYYYAMELIDGMPLNQYVRSRALSRDQILILMRTVCQAVLFAHLHAVIHRDLKPSNILVSPDGQPHVLDFGLAKGLLEEEDALAISVEGQIAGTPAYMSPEQAAGHHSLLDTRTDVFSLGVILYELLIGQSPHDLSGSMFDVLHQIMEGGIRRPREVDKSIDDELEAILLKALARDPDDRYASAGALAKDITSYLDEEPLDARVPTLHYFLRKKAYKYRIQAAAILIVLLLVLVTMIAAYTKGVQTKTLRDAMDRALEFSERPWDDLEKEVSGSDSQNALAALRVLRNRYVAAQDEISQLNHKLGERELPVEVRRLALPSGEALASAALVRKPFLPERVHSWTLETLGHHGSVMRLAYSSDGSRLASAGSDGTLRTWDAESGRLVNIFVDPNGTVDLPWPPKDGETGGLSWWADEAAPAAGEMITRWKVDMPDTWQPLLRTVRAIATSPDRSTLALGDHDGTIRLVDLKSGQLRRTYTPSWCGPIHSVCFSSDGKVLATCAGPGTICLWDAHTWRTLRKFEARDIGVGLALGANTLAWGPGDTVIARPDRRQETLEILDSQSGQVLRVISGNSQRITSVSWAPDGTLLAAGTIDGKALVWDAKSNSGQPLATLDAHTGSVNVLAWMPQDQSLITAGNDGKIAVWEPRSGTRAKIIEGYPAPITCLAFSPNGKTLAVGSDNGIIRLWDTEGNWTSSLLRGEPNDIEARESKFTAVTWSSDGALLASGDALGRIRIWNPKSRRPTRSFGAGCGRINSLAWSGDGRILICGGADGTSRAWNVKNDFQEHVVLLPLWGFAGPGIAINREGDYRGPPGMTEHLLYIVSTERGQETLTSADFKSRFGWINEPWQVGLFAPGVEQVKRIYVKADAQPPYDGNSWDTAFNDLQDALSVAQSNTEIWVATGTYRPDRGTGAREASFRLKSGVRLFGGFAGTETSIDQRDPNENETKLSGDLKGDDKTNFTNYDDNSYHVVLADNTDSSTVLDGFIIAGGNAKGPRTAHDLTNILGGGMLSREGSSTLIDCIFTYNLASAGGGIYIQGGKPILRDCCFINNKSYVDSDCHLAHGGGIFNSNADTVIINCTFRGNTSAVYGGALNNDNCELVLTDCTFINNSAGDGGGICTWTYLRGGVTSLTNCKFAGNSAKGAGGGIYCRAEQTKLMKLKLANCTFSGNLAMGRGGGISNGYYYEPILINCTFMKNESPHCGGVWSGEKSKATLTNCVLWANTGIAGMDESVQIEGGTIVADHCCIQGWSGKLGGTGNFGLDPLFVDPNGPDGKIGTLDDNLRLDVASACRNAGNNSALGADTADLDKDGDVNEPIPFDIDGKPRIQGGVVDLGAYESN